MENKNKEYGKHLARVFYGSDVKYYRLTLNSEQAEAFKKEWKRLCHFRN